MPKPNERWRRLFSRRGSNTSPSGKMVSSRLADRYQRMAFSPARISWPPISKSSVAVRRIWASGVCQRISSDTPFEIRVGSAIIFAQFSG